MISHSQISFHDSFSLSQEKENKIIHIHFSLFKDACARVSCNYGTCINEGTSYRCECHQGYEGATCDRMIDPCSNFVCYNGGICRFESDNRPYCQCAQGFRGANCYESDGTFLFLSSDSLSTLLVFADFFLDYASFVLSS